MIDLESGLSHNCFFVLQISVEDRVRLEISSKGQKTKVLCVPNRLSFRYNYYLVYSVVANHNGVFSLSGYYFKKASNGSNFIIYLQSTGQKLGPPLGLRVSYQQYIVHLVRLEP